MKTSDATIGKGAGEVAGIDDRGRVPATAEDRSSPRFRGNGEPTDFGLPYLSFPVFDTSGHAIAAMTLPFLVRTDLPSTIDDARTLLRRAAAKLSSGMCA